jgi:hypothetical protein
MSCVVYSISEDFVPPASPGDPVIVDYTFDNNQEQDDVGAKIHVDAPIHTTIVTVSHGANTDLTISDDKLSADVVTGVVSGGRKADPAFWVVNRSVTLSIDADAPVGQTLGEGKIAYYNAAGELGPSCSLSVTSISADARPIDVQFSKQGSWQDWSTQGWIYSYRISLTSTSKAITDWIVYFDQLPVGTTIYDASTLWVKITMDGTEGTVALQTPDGTHIIPTDTQLNIDFQLLYPNSKDNPDQYNTLYDLVAYDIGT